MYAYGGVTLARVLFREFDGLEGVLEVGACDDEFADAGGGGAGDDGGEVGGVGGGGAVVVEALVGGVGEVDADLELG